MRSVFRFLGFALALTAILLIVLWLRNTVTPVAGERPGGDLLVEMDREFTALVARSLPSVVSIDALPPDQPMPTLNLFRMLFGPGDTRSQPPQLGAGVVVSEEGYLVTNFHVIKGTAQVRVYLNDGRVLPARMVGADSMSDIAVLQIEAEGLTPLAFGDSDLVAIGQSVFAVGNPLGLQETVTSGIISGKGRRAASEAANEFFQTDAAINVGNSGGPLINLRGELVGLTNMLISDGKGIGFAIPSNTVRRVFESIRDHGRFIRPWFGAMARPLSPALARQLRISAPSGAVIVGTYQGSPADRAGLQPGDIVTAYDGKPTVDHIDLRNRVAETPIGTEVTLTVLRGNQSLTIPTVIDREPGP